MSFNFRKTVLSLFLFAGISGTAQAQDAGYAARLELAKSYAQTMSARKMVDNTMAEIVKNPQLGITQADVATMKETIDFDKMDQVILDALAKTFSEEELKALAGFYGSPTGKSIISKMPAYMSTVTPFVQQSVMDAVVATIQKKQGGAAVPAGH